MTKKKKPDNLGQDVLEAERLGYGCHYGDYIAARDNHTADYERREREAPPAREPEARPESLNGPVVITQGGKQFCQICGKPLGKNAKKYCKGECQQIAYDRYHHINRNRV